MTFVDEKLSDFHVPCLPFIFFISPPDVPLNGDEIATKFRGKSRGDMKKNEGQTGEAKFT